MSDYRIVLRAYPSSYRRDHGPEFVDIANELADDGWSFRQSRSLLAGGLRTRARGATGGSPRSVWASGVRLGLLVWLVAGVAPLLAFAARLYSSPTYDLSPLGIILALASIAAMTISTRWWVAVLVTVSQGWNVYALLVDSVTPRVIIEALAVLAAAVIGLAWWLAVATDGRRAASPIAAGALLATATILSGLYGVGGASPALVLVVPAVLVLGGLMVSRIDPRLVVSGTVLVALSVVPMLPIGLSNDDIGWNYWAPIGISLLALSVMAAASWSGIRRLSRA